MELPSKGAGPDLNLSFATKWRMYSGEDKIESSQGHSIGSDRLNRADPSATAVSYVSKLAGTIHHYYRTSLHEHLTIHFGQYFSDSDQEHWSG